MRFRAFISWKGNAEPLAKRRRDEVHAAPASGTKEVVARNERRAGDAHGREDEIGGVSQAFRGKLSDALEHLRRKQE
jgi:hypothetical protein